ncbi:hypothetical protein EB796_018828 [Bugula neritina]|uniref:Uncharacterized protein n=1 Tax=Bugula neritina TaxID=10212 RepID=A0A7J7JB05_BUGNE|nr:hypothetical protein EB796_018828 [Bugula neritina]
MHTNKRARLELGAAATSSAVESDPFAEEEDWEDDDIMQLVANEIPTCSQLSQAITAPPIKRQTSNEKADTPQGTKPRSFTFKRPLSVSSVVTAKPSSYTSSAVETKSEPSNISQSQTALNLSDLNGVDLETMRKQISDLIRKQHAHEGEIKWLRSTLKDKETQVNKVRVTLNAEAARQRLEHSEKERRFMKDIETLRSDLQFKENELVSVGQALEKLKKEKQKTLATAMKLGVDGFPTSTEGFNPKTSPTKPAILSKSYGHRAIQNGAQSTNSSSADAPTAAECDLKPQECNRLFPRKLNPGEYKRKMILSELLKSNMELVRQQLESLASNDKTGNSSELLSDSIEYTKHLYFL